MCSIHINFGKHSMCYINKTDIDRVPPIFSQRLNNIFLHKTVLYYVAF